VLFVIDCAYAGALTPLSDGGRSVVEEALNAAVNVLKTKVVTAPDDKVGVALYGVREKMNPNGFEGIRVVQELDKPSAQRIKQLEVEAARPADQFKERYGINHRTPLSDVFWTCTTIFNLSANPKQFQPRVFLFTGNESPCDSQAELDAAETRAHDLMDLGADVEFFPLSPPGRAFSLERFWGRILPVDAAEFVMASVSARIEELERRVRMRVHRKRTLQRIMFELCPGVEIGVCVYVTILQAGIPFPVYLLNENNKPLKSETRMICEQTGGILHPKDDLDTFVELSGQRVYVSRAEMTEVRRFYEPGLHLLCFKAANCLKPHHRIFHSYFVYPNEKAVTGSAALCAALIDRLLEKKLMAVARYVARRNSEPVLVALLPQAESLDPNGADQLRPPGFQMIRLPWGEEIRQVEFPVPEGMRLPPGVTDAARAAVRAMRLDAFRPGCAENPVLQRHYAAVQALALGEDAPEETVDVLQPDNEALKEKQPVLQAWRDAIEAGSAAIGAALGTVKRPAPPGAEEDDSVRAAPRPRREAPPAAPTTLEAMRDMVRSGEVDRLTVPMLKDWLKSQGIVASGKKVDLVERVRAVA